AFYGKFATFDNKALIVDNVLIAYAVGNKTREYNIPNNVITIGESAFCAGYNLTEITIPESVKEINYGAFYKCLALPKISIPKNVAKIGEYAFALCEKLTNITIPNSVTEIGGLAFSGCSYLCQVFCKAITPPVAIESKDHPGTWSAFVGNAQGRRIYVPAESIDAYRMADWWNNYASAIVADNLDRISNNEIWYTSIDGNSITPYATAAFGVNIVSNTYENGNGIITFDGDVAKIGNNAFYNCSSLTSVTIPNSVTVIGDSAFRECSSLTNITIPDSVTKIGDYALYQCTSLTNITIPNNITAIGKGAFFDCRSLTSVYCKPITPPSVGLYIFHDALTGLKIFVPIGSGDAYKAADGWKRYAYAIQEKAM
ncbi:MAG: leucine-rich repeat domain-containing protein, partial [Alistipes sp.]|nr:leucine-rich repeat domain-containing protein [Alistipes sp.]